MRWNMEGIGRGKDVPLKPIVLPGTSSLTEHNMGGPLELRIAMQVLILFGVWSF